MIAQRPARPRRRRLPDRPQVGDRRQEPASARSTSSATPTRATPAPSWTAACWRATRTASSRAWRSPPTPSAPTQGYIYVRAEYPLAVQRLRDRHRARPKRLGLLGSSIFDTPFDFRVDIRIGAGAFVCGEETALIASIEGRRGTPRPRPPYPAEAGLWGCPTLINNVETFANIAPIIRNGADWFAAHRHGEEQGHQGLRPGRQDRQHRPDRGADGHHAPRDRRGDRRRHRRRRHDQGRADRRAVGRLHPRRSTSTRRSITSRSPQSARSWARAA